ncbi:two-component system sensor histidine kinase/response regulator [Thioploca ingrica]|uniref:Two-component system sensor histidine kinase/response regulator n=1 Tax=Thioploca ingrica TaxID=40754 RepID=A0A090ALB7_9GAMM|nr:two-component system sensor histidine kinase/response regulator [Thioploca ingrica]
MKYFLLIISLWLSSLQAAELVFDPPTPVVSVGQRLTLSVSGASGEVTWSAGKGQILGSGTQVTYIAPEGVGPDRVTAFDEAENDGVVKITVSNQTISRENAQWEVFTDRRWITALLLSEDGRTLWVGTSGGLEQRDAKTGELQKVFLNTDGLPSNWVTSLLSDGQGGVWIGLLVDFRGGGNEGTGGGLVHRSGLGEWTVYNTENSKLPDNWIQSLLSDGQGGLWIGTNSGLAHLTGLGEWTIYYPKNSGLPSDQIYSLLSDGQGGIWVGTVFGGLAHLTESGEWTVYDQENSDLPNNTIRSLLSDGQGGLWIGTLQEDGYGGWIGGGLVHWNRSDEWTGYQQENSGLPDDTVNSLLSDGKGGLWIGTTGGLAHQSSTGEWLSDNQENSGLPDNEVNSLVSDGQGGLWIGTTGGLAHQSSTGEWLSDNQENSGLPDNEVNSLLNDGQGGLWIGSSGGGLAHWSGPGEWISYYLKNSGLPDNWVDSLLSDGKGGLWIGTDGGLAHLTGTGEWTVYYQENWRPSDEITSSDNIASLVSDGQDGLWIGTSLGLAHLSGSGEWTAYNQKNSRLPDNEVNSLISDGQSGLWIGTGEGGLAHLSKLDKWTIYNEENSELPDNGVTSLLSDVQGGLWMGTWGGGLAHLTGLGEWTVYNTENSGLPGNYIVSLLSDGQGGLWVGTGYGGLAYLTGSGEWTVYNTENSKLLGNEVHSLLSDGQGGLWIGTNSGLAHLTFSRKTALCSQAQIDDQTCQDLQQGQRAAILIAGGGAETNNSLWGTTQTITNRFYQTFYRRGFDHNEIYYLSSDQWTDFNGDGLNDRIVDAPTEPRSITLDDVKQALEWAKQRGQLTQPLYFFFMDHGGDGRLMLSSSQELTASDFKALLDDYQTVTGNAVVVILEACHSGSFLQTLQAPKRAIISSAKGDELAYFIENRGFSYFLADYLLQGRNFHEAFGLATQAQSKLSGHNLDLTGAIERGQLTSQTPQLDDTHDGLYTSDDGQWLQTVYINGNFQTADSTLAVENLTTSTTLQAGQPLTLKVKATTVSGHVKSVWAIVHPPKMDFLRDIHGTPISPYPRLNFVPTGQENVWQTTWQETLYNGNYDITIHAQDHDNNEAHGDESIKITVTNGINPPATANVQLQLGQTRYQRGEQFTAKLIENLNWGYDLYAAVVMPDGQFLTFKKLNEPGLSDQPNHWLAPRQQNEPLTVIDLTLPESLSTGEYCLYGILSPQDQPPLEIQPSWKWEKQCFEIF